MLLISIKKKFFYSFFIFFFGGEDDGDCDSRIREVSDKDETVEDILELTSEGHCTSGIGEEGGVGVCQDKGDVEPEWKGERFRGAGDLSAFNKIIVVSESESEAGLRISLKTMLLLFNCSVIFKCFQFYS